MPEKSKTYNGVIFTPEVIKEAVDLVSGRNPIDETLRIELPSGEEWEHDKEEEFFADYRKGFGYAVFRKNYGYGKGIELSTYGSDTGVSVLMPSRTDVEKVFNFLEANVDKCRLPKQPKKTSEAKTEWITEAVNKIETHCPIAAHKVKLALIKLESDETEEWQNATMLIRDAWIELTRWLCQVNNIDTSDVSPDSVIDRLKKLKIDMADERLFNLARASFNLYGKHHKRDIDHDTAVACVISTVVSMKTVIREVF